MFLEATAEGLKDLALLSSEDISHSIAAGIVGQHLYQMP